MTRQSFPKAGPLTWVPEADEPGARHQPQVLFRGLVFADPGAVEISKRLLMVENSIKSDILPVLDLDTQGVYRPPGCTR